VNIGLTRTIARKENRLPIPRKVRPQVGQIVFGDPTQRIALGIHEIDLSLAVAARTEGDHPIR
jgi:hypothetical protein